MQIQINGEQKQISNGITVTALIHKLGLSGKRIAVEINEELVTRSTFDQYHLQPEDRVEIIYAIGGG